MTTIHVEQESECPTGWIHRVTITRTDPRDPDESIRQLTVSLSFQDYEYWSGGSRPPEQITQALVGALLEPDEDASVPNKLPEQFDASTARRWMPSLDARLRGSAWH